MTIARGREVWYNDGKRNETQLFPKGDCTDMKKRLLCALLCAVLLTGLIPAAALTSSAATAEGDWTVYRTPKSYEDEKNGETVKPAPGYRYTADGFTTVEPDWTNFTPYFTVQTKEAQPLKDGIYLEFRVDEYPYGGEDGGADHWLSFSLSDRENVDPGNIDFGNNWLGLIRGAGEGSASAQSFITTMTTDEDVGTFVHNGDVSVTVPVDDEGREIYTLEIIWDGSEYDIKICGTTVMGCADITAKLEEWNADGEFFVANEAGPEMVGKIGSKTTVANNQQIIEGIAEGVYKAIMSAIKQFDFDGSQPINISLDGRQIAAAIEKRVRERGATLIKNGLFNY